MKIVIDTNIVFSALLNPSGQIGERIINAAENIEFYAPEFLRIELKKHTAKLLKLSKLSEVALEELAYIITRNIRFISEEQIPTEIWETTENILQNIDIKDVPFVALSQWLDGYLWTGDKKLSKGLAGTDFIKCLSTLDFINLQKGDK